MMRAPVTAKPIGLRTPLISTVLMYIQEGAPDSAEDKLKLYSTKQSELTLHAGCIVWAGRVVVPPPGRERVATD